MTRRLVLALSFALTLPLLPACGDDGGDQTVCDFELDIALSAQPTYSFTGGPVNKVNVVRAEDPDTIVWGVSTPNADELASPIVHGQVPAGAIQTAGAEPTLSGGIDYQVIVERTSGSRCEQGFTP